MINKDFIAGLAIGAIRAEKTNLSEHNYPYVEWDETAKDTLRLRIKYQCSLYLEDLEEMERMLESFYEINSIVVGGSIDIYINTKSDGKQLDD